MGMDGIGTVPIMSAIVFSCIAKANRTNKHQQQKCYPVLLHAVEEHGDWTPITSHGMVPWSGPDRGLSNTDRAPVHGKPVTHTGLVTCTGGGKFDSCWNRAANGKLFSVFRKIRASMRAREMR